MTRAERRIPNVLTIAGSDPSGGAGLQADLENLFGAPLLRHGGRHRAHGAKYAACRERSSGRARNRRRADRCDFRRHRRRCGEDRHAGAVRDCASGRRSVDAREGAQHHSRSGPCRHQRRRIVGRRPERCALFFFAAGGGARHSKSCGSRCANGRRRRARCAERWRRKRVSSCRKARRRRL